MQRAGLIGCLKGLVRAHRPISATKPKHMEGFWECLSEQSPIPMAWSQLSASGKSPQEMCSGCQGASSTPVDLLGAGADGSRVAATPGRVGAIWQGHWATCLKAGRSRSFKLDASALALDHHFVDRYASARAQLADAAVMYIAGVHSMTWNRLAPVLTEAS